MDDGLEIGTDKNEINVFIEKLKQEFKITTGSFDSYIGMQIKQETDGSI